MRTQEKENERSIDSSINIDDENRRRENRMKTTTTTTSRETNP